MQGKKRSISVSQARNLRCIICGQTLHGWRWTDPYEDERGYESQTIDGRPSVSTMCCGKEYWLKPSAFTLTTIHEG